MSFAENVTLNLKLPRDFFKDYARGKPCQIRVAASCGYTCMNEETTVLCHPSIAGLKAMGSRKSSVPDIGGAWGCMVCHDLVDGRRKPKPGSTMADVPDGTIRKTLLQNAFLEGVIRTVHELVKRGVLPNP